LKIMGIDEEIGGLFAPRLQVSLSDPGLWGRAWALFSDGHGPAAAAEARMWTASGRRLFDQIKSEPPPASPPQWLA
jgi:hypothetical protein